MLHVDHINNFLSSEEADAAHLLASSLGYVPWRSFAFWETLIGRILDGKRTTHCDPGDLILGVGYDLLVEVKHSQDFSCEFRNGRRRVFKFANPLGVGSQPKDVDALVLVGARNDGRFSTWVMPPQAVRGRASITLSVERDRKYFGRYWHDQFNVPPDVLLAAVTRCCRLAAGDSSLAHLSKQANLFDRRS